MNKQPQEMTFDQLQRYRLAAELVEEVRDRTPWKILDGGGREGFLRHYLPGDRIINLDRNFFSGDNFVQGDVLRLPFADSNFDLAVSLDVLEHIPGGRREDMLSEISRVSRRGFLVGAPFRSEEVEEYEKLVANFSRKISGRSNEFIVQHQEEGLPHLPEVLEWAKSRGYRTAVIPNGFLPRWLAMMGLNEYLGRLPDPWELIFAANRIYHERFYRTDNAAPAYRQMIIFVKTGDLDSDTIISKYVSKAAGEIAPADTFRFFKQLLETIEEEKDNLIRKLAGEKNRGERELAQISGELASVRRELDALKATYAYRAYKKTLGRLADVFRNGPAGGQP